jgi:hypothetical protein
MEAIVFGSAVVVSLVWRFAGIPWDLGGCFYHVWVSMVVLAILAKAPRQMKGVPRIILDSTMVPAGIFLVFGSIRFAPQALFPIMLMSFVVAGATWLWSRSKPAQAFLVTLLLLPCMAYLVFSTAFPTWHGSLASEGWRQAR